MWTFGLSSMFFLLLVVLTRNWLVGLIGLCGLIVKLGKFTTERENKGSVRISLVEKSGESKQVVVLFEWLLLTVILMSHLGFYALVNLRSRYVEEVIPVLVVSLVVLMWLVSKKWIGNRVGGWLCVLAGVVLASSTMTRVRAYHKPQVSLQVKQGLAIGQTLNEHIYDPIILTHSWSVPYYAGGLGVKVPYNEARVEKLLTFMDKQRIGYVAIPETIEGAVVPTYFMLEIMNKSFPDWIKFDETNDLFVKQTRIKSETVGEAQGGDEVGLDPGRYFLEVEAVSGSDYGKKVTTGLVWPVEKDENMKGVAFSPLSQSEKSVWIYFAIERKAKFTLVIPSEVVGDAVKLEIRKVKIISLESL